MFLHSRRRDKSPTKYSMVCSCHFGTFARNEFPTIYSTRKTNVGNPRKRNRHMAIEVGTNRDQDEQVDQDEQAVHRDQDEEAIKEGQAIQVIVNNRPEDERTLEMKAMETQLAIYKIQNEELKRQLNLAKNKYEKNMYSVKMLSEELLKMETGLPNFKIFNIVVDYVRRFENSITYYNNWSATSWSLEDQILITLMKLRQNYTNLHIATLFHCSRTTVSNIFLTFIHVLSNLFGGVMESIPSVSKNSKSLPESFKPFSNCRIVIDCTDIQMATPPQMDIQNLTYSSYRGMNSFKALIGVAPNAVITFVSKVYPGSTSDKQIVLGCGLLGQLSSGDMVMADKGFLIHDVVPYGVTVNIPPFLHNKFTENEAKRTKEIARCRIHVERANARIKDFRILNFVPSSLRMHIDVILKTVVGLVNLQAPLIKAINTEVFD